jgi:hypothetical protein
MELFHVSCGSDGTPCVIFVKLNRALTMHELRIYPSNIFMN